MFTHMWRDIKAFSHNRFPAIYEFLWRLRNGSSGESEYEEVVIPEKYYKLEHIIRAITGGSGLFVQTGPFEGMAYESRSAGSAYYPKLLGSYEAELHELIETVAGRHYDDVINTGL